MTDHLYMIMDHLFNVQNVIFSFTGMNQRIYKTDKNKPNT